MSLAHVRGHREGYGVEERGDRFETGTSTQREYGRLRNCRHIVSRLVPFPFFPFFFPFFLFEDTARVCAVLNAFSELVSELVPVEICKPRFASMARTEMMYRFRLHRSRLNDCVIVIIPSLSSLLLQSRLADILCAIAVRPFHIRPPFFFS